MTLTCTHLMWNIYFHIADSLFDRSVPSFSAVGQAVIFHLILQWPCSMAVVRDNGLYVSSYLLHVCALDGNVNSLSLASDWVFTGLV